MSGTKPYSRMLGPWQADIEFAKIDASTSGDNQVVAAQAGKSILVLHVLVIAAAAVTVKFRSNATDITGPLSLAANGGFVDDSDLGIFRTEEGETLNINLSGNQAVGGCVTYAIV